MWESKWMILCFFDINALYLPDMLDLKPQAISLTEICCILSLRVWVGDQDLWISWRRHLVVYQALWTGSSSCCCVVYMSIHMCIGQRSILDVPQSLLQHFKIFIDCTCSLTISYMFITCGLLSASALFLNLPPNPVIPFLTTISFPNSCLVLVL